MNMTWRNLALLLALVGLLPLSLAQAQGDDRNDTGVYVTTQDYSSLRLGPGLNFERITVIDPAVTMMAVGRTSNAEWVQVEYEGQYGWIISWLLVWSGDLVQLPVDGIDPAPFIRRTGVAGVTTRETPIYRRFVHFSDQVGTLPAGTGVEVTGRLGAGRYYQVQILYEGQLYWVGSWNIRGIGRNFRALFDTSYLYPYGRLVVEFQRDIDTAVRRLSQIEDIWRRLQAGRSVSCGFMPLYVTRSTTDTDVRQEPNFAPAVRAFDSGAAQINAAIAAFEDACGREETNFYLTQQEVDDALIEIENARRNLVVSDSLLNSLQVRNPLVTNR